MIFKDNTYFQTPKYAQEDRLQVEIGDSKQADLFYPQIKSMRWDGEVNLSVRLVDSFSGKAVVSQEGEKVKWIKPEIESHFYSHPISEEYPEGGFEFEIILKEKPPSNKLSFSIRTKGLDFFFQPPLTQKEINDGANRPENVIGSYAVYHSTKNGDYSPSGGKNYRAGKAFHIPKPKIKDAIGREIWGKLSIDVVKETLEISIEQSFLDSAIYPINIDPTFGYTTAGASTTTTAANTTYGSLFTSPADVATASSISCYFDTSALASVKGLLVNHSNLNIITDGVGQSVQGGAAAWRTSLFSTTPNLTPNLDYVLMGIFNGICNFYYDTGDTNQGHYDTSNSFDTPTNPTDAVHSNNKYSIYCTYIVPTNINILDSFSFSDNILVGESKTISDFLSLSDLDPSIQANIPILDTVAFSEILSIINQFSISDLITLLDNLTIKSNISISDSITLSDSIIREIGVLISDTLALVDTLYFRKAFVVLNLSTPIVTQIDVTGAIIKMINIDSKIGG